MAKKEKIYVLDTSVLLHDHQSISTFEDNNVAIPITVLEELDKFKVGNDTKNMCNATVNKPAGGKRTVTNEKCIFPRGREGILSR